MLVLLDACAIQEARTTATWPSATPATTAMPSPTIPPATATAVPPLTPTARAAREPLTLPLPLSGWEWHESSGKGYAFMKPQSWNYRPAYRDKTYQSPETATLISVDTHPLPAGTDWLAWLRQNHLEISFPAMEPAEVTADQLQPYREGIVGIVTKAESRDHDVRITADDGQSYQLSLAPAYNFGGRASELTFLRISDIAEGDRMLVVGYPLASGGLRPE